MLQIKHEQRVAKDLEFRFLKEDIGEFQQLKNKKSTSLNETVRRQEREARAAKVKDRQSLRQRAVAGDDKAAKSPIQDDGLQANERSLSAELAAEQAAKAAKDIFQLEAANILADELALIQTSTRLAQQVLSGFSRLKADAAPPSTQ